MTLQSPLSKSLKMDFCRVVMSTIVIEVYPKVDPLITKYVYIKANSFKLSCTFVCDNFDSFFPQRMGLFGLKKQRGKLYNCL